MPLWLFLAFGLTACSAPPLPDFTIVDEAPAHEGLRAACRRMVPPAVKVLQRVLLEIDGRESTFLVYALLYPPDSLIIQGFGELGGSSFAVRRAAGTGETHGAPAFLPDRFLESRFAEDELLAMFPPAVPNWSAALLTTGEPVLTSLHGGRQYLLRRNEGGLDLTLEVGKDKRWLSTLHFEDWARDQNGNPVFPRLVLVHGRYPDYNATITVLSWEPLALSESDFLHRFQSAFQREP